MGHRLGSATLPFASISAALFRRTAVANDGGLVLAGLVLHVTTAFVWSFVFVWLVRRVHLGDIVAATVTALGELVVSGMIAWLVGAGIATVMPLGDRLVLAVVYVIALVVGMRFAFPALRNA